MAEDKRAEPPDAKPTVSLPAIPAWAVDLKASMVNEFSVLHSEVNRVSKSVETLQIRAEGQDARVSELEARSVNASMRIRSASVVDVETTDQLAKERQARESLAKEVQDLKESTRNQTIILTKLDTLTNNPLLKVVFTMLLTSFIAWLAAHNVKVGPEHDVPHIARESNGVPQ